MMMRCGGRPRDAPSPPAATAAADIAGDVGMVRDVGLVHEGWMRKLSRKGLRGRAWCRRWVVISDDGMLKVFKTQGSKKPTKSVNLADNLVTRQLYADDEGAMIHRGIDTNDGSDLAFIFELVLRRNGKALLFACETEPELEAWIADIETENARRASGRSTPGRRDRFDSTVLRDLGCNPETTHSSWNDRLQAVLDLPNGQNKLLGIATVASDFVVEATKFVAVVVDEYAVPRPLQKFPPLLHTDLGHHGYERDEHAQAIYFENDVLYQVLNAPAASVALQTKSSFVSTNKLSVTTALQEQLGAQLLHNVDRSVAKKLRTALTVVISYAGFRISATAVLPVSPGTLAYGVGCADPDERLCNLIDRAMEQHGLCRHPIGRRVLFPAGGGGIERETSPSYKISTGINVAGHRGEDGRFYLTNLEGICPADLLPVSSEEWTSPGDAGTAAKTALGTRYLRPELVARYVQESGEMLSSNSFLALDESTEEDRLINEEFEWAASRASGFLRDSVIAEFSAQLNQVELLPCSGAALTVAMHRAGINMRFLGLLAVRATLPHVHDLLVVEMVARQAKHLLSQNLLRQQLRSSGHLHGDGLVRTAVELRLREVEIERRETVIDFFNLLLGETPASISYWANVIVPAVRRAYSVDVARCEVRRVALACALQMACGVELRPTASALATWRRDFVRPMSTPDANVASWSGAVPGVTPLTCEPEPEVELDDNDNAGVESGRDLAGDRIDAGSGLLSVRDFVRWSSVLRQPWVAVPFTFQHQLLSNSDLRAAVVRPRRLWYKDSLPGDAAKVCSAAGTTFDRKCLEWTGEAASASLRKTFAACCRCLRREEQLRLAGDLALAAAASGQFDEALSLIEEAEVRLLRGGCEDGEVGRLMLVIAHLHHVRQNSDAARQYCTRGLQAVTASWGQHHPLLLELHGLMALIELDGGDQHSCLAHRQACLKVSSIALGLQHVATACYANAVGLDCLQLAAGEASDAVGHHQRALAVYQTTFGKSHAGTASCAFYLAAALQRAGDYEQAAAMSKDAADTRRALASSAQGTEEEEEGAILDDDAEDRALLLMQSLAQIAEVADARDDFEAAATALHELMNLPATTTHAEAAVEAAAAATLRVCLRTQISFELAAALQQPSTAVATLFRQAFAARSQTDQERTEAGQRQMQKVEKVAVRTARKLCLQPLSTAVSDDDGSPVAGKATSANDYVMKLRAQVASGMGGGLATPGKDLSNVLTATPKRGSLTPARTQNSIAKRSARKSARGNLALQASPAVAEDARTARKRHLQAQLTAELELGCLRLMLASDGRASDLLEMAASGLAKEHAPVKAAVVTESWEQGVDFF